MATFNSVLAAAFNASPSTGGPANWQLPGVINTPVRCFVDSYAPAGTEAAGTIIRLFTDGVNQVLPAGANILMFHINMAGSTASLTFSLGDRSLATRYATASTGPATAGMTTISGAVSGIPYIIGTNPSTAATGVETNGDNQIIVTTGGATLSATTSIFSVVMYFTLTN